MPIPALVLAASAAWAAAALSVQALRAWRGRRREFAVPAGSPLRGILYSFTGAMTPAKKESISRHPLSFAAGLALHAAVFCAFGTALAVAVFPSAAGARWLAAPLALGLTACGALLVRRLVRRELLQLSAPEDFAANLIVATFLAVALLFHLGWLAAGPFQLVAAAVLVYLPLGKLRHVVFFFLARADLGARLGRRGVYPPARRPRTIA